MSDDLFVQVHEELVQEYLESHPGASWTTAYEATTLMAYEAWRERLEDAADSRD